MQKTKLITLLKTFSKKEMKDFEKFVASPYFSPGRNLIPLYKQLRKYYPSFASESLTKEKVFRKLYPGRKFEKKKSGHVMQVQVSELILLAEKFLAFEKMQKDCDGYYLHKFLSSAFFDRKLLNLSRNVVLKNTERIKKSESDTQYFVEMISLNSELKELDLASDIQKDLFGTDKKIPLYLYGYLTSWLLCLVNNYAASKQLSHYVNPSDLKLLKMGINAFDHVLFEKVCYDDGLWTKQMILTTYFVLKSHINTKDKENLKSAIGLYKKNFHNFKRSVNWGLLATILNLCSIRIGESGDYYATLGSDLIDFVIDKGFIDLHEGNPMMPMVYLAFLHLKMYVAGYESLKIYIAKTIVKTDQNDRKFLSEYSYAWLSFKNFDYEKTLEYLSKFSYHEITIKYTAAMLKIASLYSLGYIEEAIYSIEAIERSLRSNEQKTGISDEVVFHFIKAVRFLIKYKTNSVISDEQTLNKIKEYKNNYFKFWFKAEAEKLISSL